MSNKTFSFIKKNHQKAVTRAKAIARSKAKPLLGLAKMIRNIFTSWIQKKLVLAGLDLITIALIMQAVNYLTSKVFNSIERFLGASPEQESIDKPPSNSSPNTQPKPSSTKAKKKHPVKRHSHAGNKAKKSR